MQKKRLSFSEKEGKVFYQIISHLKLSFVADRPPPPHIAYQELLMPAETSLLAVVLISLKMMNLFSEKHILAFEIDGEIQTREKLKLRG